MAVIKPVADTGQIFQPKGAPGALRGLNKGLSKSIASLVATLERGTKQPLLLRHWPQLEIDAKPTGAHLLPGLNTGVFDARNINDAK
jgi:hypothetical protein